MSQSDVVDLQLGAVRQENAVVREFLLDFPLELDVWG